MARSGVQDGTKKTVQEIVTERIMQSLQEGTVPWVTPWVSLPARNLKGNVYRGINWMLLKTARREDPRWVTFNQAKELGYYPREGCKPEIVAFYKTLPSKEEGGKPFMLLRYYRIFNVADIEGIFDKIPSTEEYVNSLTPPKEMLEMSIDRLVAGMASVPSIQHGGSDAFYRPSTDSVQMPLRSAFTKDVRYWQTLAHEIAHSSGAASRLDRKSVVNGLHDKERYSLEELVAEMTAAMLLLHFGLVPEMDQSAAYIESWLRVFKGDSSMVLKAAAQAQAAFDYITGAKPFAESQED